MFIEDWQRLVTAVNQVAYTHSHSKPQLADRVSREAEDFSHLSAPTTMEELRQRREVALELIEGWGVIAE